MSPVTRGPRTQPEVSTNMMTAPRDPRAELLRCGDVETNPGPGPSVVPPALQELGGRRGPPSRSGRRSVSQGPTVEEQVRPRDTQYPGESYTFCSNTFAI